MAPDEVRLFKTSDSADDAGYYLHLDASRLNAYKLRGETICILERDGRLRELSESADVASVGAQAGVVEKAYVCAPKEIALSLPRP